MTTRTAERWLKDNQRLILSILRKGEGHGMSSFAQENITGLAKQWGADGVQALVPQDVATDVAELAMVLGVPKDHVIHAALGLILKECTRTADCGELRPPERFSREVLAAKEWAENRNIPFD